MGKTDPRIDAFIAKSADFAKPILHRLRKLVHQGCPEAEETLKWGMPSFLYGGEILCGMAASYAAFSPSKRREYVEWLMDAKTDATREKRLATAIAWMAEGKEYNWKYKR